jgi:pimeloyl-ACP methyl ester carboxylesterase
VPELERPDGTRIHYQIEGEDGPTLVLASYWSWSPQVWTELLADLAADHRVVTYHLRGTGDSSRDGPYEMETDTGDLEAVVEAASGEAGGGTLVVGVADSANRATRLGVRRPELASAVVCVGTAPFSPQSLEGSEAMLSSESVLGAFREMLEHNHRGAMRVLLEATNPQMSDEELRERLEALVEFCPQAPALGRLRGWMEDDPLGDAQRLGERLWIFAGADVAGPWLPPRDELDRLKEELMPEARVELVEPGPSTAPHQTAEAMRRVSAPLRGGAAQGRK